MDDRRQTFIALLEQGRNDEVLTSLVPRNGENLLGEAASRLFQGVALQQSGRLEEAIEAYRKAAQQSLSDLLMSWNNLAGACYNVESFREAIEVVEQLRDYKPFDVELLALHVLALVALGRKAEAEQIAREFAGKVPRNAGVARWAIHAVWRNRRYVEALLRSSEISPDAWDAGGLGHELLQCFIELELFEVAETMFPVVYGADCNVLDREETWATAGYLALCSGQLHKAREIYEAGLGRGYSDRSAILNLSLAELLLGDFEKGWLHYTVRAEDRNYLRVMLPESVPYWRGESLKGKTIVVSSEQGIGDMIQFLRFVPELERLGARVLFASYPDVVQLLRNDPQAKSLEMAPLQADDIDFYTLLLDLPHQLGVKEPADIPCRIPYLFANAGKAAEWNSYFEAIDGIKVGLAWAGNPQFTGDHYRSASINIFSPLAGMQGVTFVGLQKGIGAKEAQCPPEGLPYEWIGDRFASFEDTAAAIVNLDLVISTDTSIVHLAAALGKPVWLLLSKRSLDYRWADFGNGNAWYPTVTVFQQDTDDDWVGLLRDKIRPALANKILADGAPEIAAWAKTALRLDGEPAAWEQCNWVTWAQSVTASKAEDAASRWLARQISERDISIAVDALVECSGGKESLRQQPSLMAAVARHLLKLGDAENGNALFAELATTCGDAAVGRMGFLDWGWNHYVQGRFSQALELWKRGCEIAPRDGHLHYLQAIALRESGRPKEAVTELRNALACSPRHYMAHLSLAGLLREEKPMEAWEAAQKAVMLKRNDAVAWRFVATLFHDRGMYGLAERILWEKGQPEVDFGSRVCRIKQLLMLGLDTEAEALLRDTPLDRSVPLAVQQDYASALYHAGMREDAVRLLADLVERYPDSREARFTLGFTQLRLGNYEEGWKNYWQAMRRDTPRHFPEWKGEDLVGKTLLVIQDQGQGDAIQFFPLLHDVWARAPKRLAVAVSPALVTLFRAQSLPFDIIDLDKLDWEDYRYDYQVDQMALPYLLGVNLMNPPHQQPSLTVPEAHLSHWQERLAEDRNLRVGIVWSGGDLFKANYVRSTALTDWRVLWEIDGINFYSLQKDIHSNQAAVFDRPLNNIAADCPNWLETLAAIASLDLVITTCTAVAHVAGSINKPTWVVLSNEYVDFRWLEDREDSPWYPSVRLIRRQKGETWQQVFYRIANDLVARYDRLSWRQPCLQSEAVAE